MTAPAGSGQAPGGVAGVVCLGGLPVVRADERVGATARRRLYRSSALPLTRPTAGRDLVALGVGTVVDLRNQGEGVTGAQVRRAGRAEVHVCPVKDPTDAEFMTRFGHDLGRPHYYLEATRRWPHLFARAVAVVAAAGPGAVLVHCSAGRDRTGQVVAMLLHLAGVPVHAIADQDEAARRSANDDLQASPRAHERALRGDDLERRLALSRRDLEEFLARVDVEEVLRRGGLAADHLVAVRKRLVDTGTSGT